MLAAVIDLLSCPQCAADLELVDGAARVRTADIDSISLVRVT